MSYAAYAGVSSPAYANPEESQINCNVVFAHLGGFSVPFTASQLDPGSEHSEEIFSRCENGDFGPVAPYTPTVSVPVRVTPAQAKIALYEADLLDQVEVLVANYPYRPVSIWWTSALAFERGHAYLNALGLELGLTDEEIDALFVAAAKK